MEGAVGPESFRTNRFPNSHCLRGGVGGAGVAVPEALKIQ